MEQQNPHSNVPPKGAENLQPLMANATQALWPSLETVAAPQIEPELREAMAQCLNSFEMREALAALVAQSQAGLAENLNSKWVFADRRANESRRGSDRRFEVEPVGDNRRFGGERRGKNDRRHTHIASPWPLHAEDR